MISKFYRRPSFYILLIGTILLAVCMTSYSWWHFTGHKFLSFQIQIGLGGIAFVLGALALFIRDGLLVKLSVNTIIVITGATFILTATGLFFLGFEADSLVPLVILAGYLAVQRASGLLLFSISTGTDTQIASYLIHIGIIIWAALTGSMIWWAFSDTSMAILTGCTMLAFSWPVLPELGKFQAIHAGQNAFKKFGIQSLAPDALERLADLQQVAFDRHTLLLNPDYVVTDVRAFDGNQVPLLAVAASAEHHADHAVAKAIRALAFAWEVPQATPEEFEEADGLGVVAMVGGEVIAIGNQALMGALKIDTFTANSLCRTHEAEGKMCLTIAAGGRAVGVFALQVNILPDSIKMLQKIKAYRLRTVLVTGIESGTATAFSSNLGFDDVIADCRFDERRSTAFSSLPGQSVLFAAPGETGGLSLHHKTSKAGQSSVLFGYLPDLPDQRAILRLPDLIALGKKSRVLINKTARIDAFTSLLGLITGATGLIPMIFAPLFPLLIIGFVRLTAKRTLY